MKNATPTKTCRKCASVKPLTEFYRNWKMRDGHLNVCKSCEKARHWKVDTNKKRASRKLWERQNREKYLAHRKLETALKHGTIKRQPCEVCGSTPAHGHHEDYSKPRDVIWLCPIHHVARHREIEAAKASADYQRRLKEAQ